MDFNDTASEAAFRAEAREWLDANRPDNWRELIELSPTETNAAGSAWQAKKADAGWAFISWPKEYGGRGASAIEQVIWQQEEGELAALTDYMVIGSGMAGPTLMRHATEDQKKELLPSLVRGDKVWCQLFSEPGAGSDLAGIRTRAERDGDDWIINGQKIWTSYAHLADFGILVTRSDPRLPKHKGLTYFYVDMHAPGVEVRPIRQISGDAEFNEVYLENVRIPDSQRLGEVGDGWNVALTTLMSERTSIGSIFGSTYEEMESYLQDLSVDGVPALQHPAVCERLADFYVNGAGMRNLNLRMMSALSKGRAPGPEGSVGKLVMARQRQNEASFMLDMQNYAGILTGEADAEEGGSFQYRFFRTAANRIEGGTDEILANIIAERVLGLPGEPRVDKDVAFADIPTA